MLLVTCGPAIIACALLGQVPVVQAPDEALMLRARQTLGRYLKVESVRRAILAQRVDIVHPEPIDILAFAHVERFGATLGPLTGNAGTTVRAEKRDTVQLQSHYTLSYEQQLVGRYVIMAACEVDGPFDGSSRKRRLPIEFKTLDGRGENGTLKHPWNLSWRVRQHGEHTFFRMLLAIPIDFGYPPVLLAAQLDTLTVVDSDKQPIEGPAAVDGKEFAESRKEK